MMDISLSTKELVFAILFLITLLIGFIVLIKSYIRHYAHAKNDENKLCLNPRMSTSEKYIFHSTGTYFNVGLLFSLSLCISILSWTSYEKNIYIPENLEWDEEIEQIPPQIFERPLPPPPPKEIVEVIEEEIIEEEPEFIDESIDEEMFLEDIPPVEEKAERPKAIFIPPPPEEELDVPEIVNFAEQMPRFPGCESMSGSQKEKENCAKEKMLQYIYKNLKYPSIAKENGIEGRVVMQFVVSKKGTIKDINIIRDIGGGCGDQASKVVNAMNNLPSRWTPGKQGGHKVDVRYTLPITFKLQK